MRRFVTGLCLSQGKALTLEVIYDMRRPQTFPPS